MITLSYEKTVGLQKSPDEITSVERIHRGTGGDCKLVCHWFLSPKCDNFEGFEFFFIPLEIQNWIFDDFYNPPFVFYASLKN